MSSIRIATSAAAGARYLGDAWSRNPDVIRSTLGDQLGPEFSQLFADPVYSHDGTSIDWYAENAEGAVCFSALTSNQQGDLRDTLGQMVAQIRNHADSMVMGDGESRKIADSLRNALEVPSENSIFAVPVGDSFRPCITEWAAYQATANGPPGLLSGWIPKSAKPEIFEGDEPAASPRQRTGPAAWLFWLGWLLLGLLFLVILWLLIPACGLARLPWTNFCSPPVSGAISALPGDILQNDVDRLERQLAELDRMCVAEREVEQAVLLPEDPIVPEAAPPPSEQSEVERRLDRENAGDGKVEFALTWEDRSDLDLHLVCPDRTYISFQNRRSSSCGGVNLDIDQNAQLRNSVSDPVEHIYIREPQIGTYKVRVHLYKEARGARVHPFTLRVKLGTEVQTIRGSVSRSRPSWAKEIQYNG